MQHQISDLTKKNQKGFVLLVATLLISAVAGVIGSSLVLMGLNTSRTSFAIEQSNQSKALANACAEEGLQQIRDSTPFTGTDTLSIGLGICDYEVTSQGGQDRTITGTGTVGTIVRKVEVIIDAINPDINVVSWQEVADL